jgi:hypothetical protein
MKQTTFTFLHFIIFTLFLAACNNDTDPVLSDSVAKIIFNVEGDFTLSTSSMTRSLTADGKDMTDVWILDYIGSELQQTIHQSASDADFGAPTLDLSMGTHHLYFIASRGTGATLNTDAKTITFSKVLDTFWRDYEITITAGTSSGSSRNVSLDRIVTKLKVTFSDAIPTGAATFNVTPQTWYYGFNYTTGNPITATSNQTVVVNIPDTEYGKTNVFLSVFGFSSTTEWTTDIALNCKTSDNTILGQATIPSAPFVRNRASEYTGLLFTDNGGWSLSLNTDWSTSHTGSW